MLLAVGYIGQLDVQYLRNGGKLPRQLEHGLEDPGFFQEGEGIEQHWVHLDLLPSPFLPPPTPFPFPRLAGELEGDGDVAEGLWSANATIGR